MTYSIEMLEELAELIEEEFEEEYLSHEFHNDELCVVVDKASIVKVLIFLRDNSDCLFTQLMSVCGADYPERFGEEGRFDVVYELLSIRQNLRLRVKVRVKENEPVPTVTGVFKSAGWFEREVWDMFGIYFEGHTDLRRILTDYGFDGHPLRKDFPLTGFVEVRYDDEKKRVVYDEVKLPQEFRRFDNMSPWEGMTDMQLPGDEKAAKPTHGYRDEGES